MEIVILVAKIKLVGMIVGGSLLCLGILIGLGVILWAKIGLWMGKKRRENNDI